MKKILSFLMVAVLAVMLAGCDKYDDTELRNKVNGYENRIAALESLASYQTLLQKLQSGKTVVSYSQSDNTITLNFSDNTSVTFNQRGEPGAPGESIQGEPGTPGAPGEPGKTPEIKIENDKWYVRYGEDGAWKEIGSAIDRSLIKDIKAEGNVLKITLADGNVINVPYGEKEGYDLIIADGRKCFSVLEKKEFYWGPKWNYIYCDIPYTLTGDLENIEDVQFSVRVVPTDNEINPYGLDAITPIDAKSGTIRLIQRPTYYKEYSNGFSDDGFYWMDWPELNVEVVAYFPDHSSVFRSFKILPLELGLQVHEDYSGDYAFEYDGSRPVMRLENKADTFKLTLWASVYGNSFSEYDGDPFPTYTNYDLFNHSTVRPANTDVFIKPAIGVSGTVVERSNYWEESFVITINVLANTTGSERYMDYEITKKIGADRYYPLFKIRFIQAK